MELAGGRIRAVTSMVGHKKDGRNSVLSFYIETTRDTIRTIQGCNLFTFSYGDKSNPKHSDQ